MILIFQVKQLGPQQVAKMRVYLGVNDITGGYNAGCSVVRKVKSIRYHRGFSMATLVSPTFHIISQNNTL